VRPQGKLEGSLVPQVVTALDRCGKTYLKVESNRLTTAQITKAFNRNKVREQIAKNKKT
jgi:hypothetical protein